MTIQIDNKNHEGISLREKINHLLKPSVAIKLVLVQKHELERIQLNNNGFKANCYIYVEQLYQHYIVENKSKTYQSPDRLKLSL